MTLFQILCFFPRTYFFSVLNSGNLDCEKHVLYTIEVQSLCIKHALCRFAHNIIFSTAL